MALLEDGNSGNRCHREYNQIDNLICLRHLLRFEVDVNLKSFFKRVIDFSRSYMDLHHISLLWYIKDKFPSHLSQFSQRKHVLR